MNISSACTYIFILLTFNEKVVSALSKAEMKYQTFVDGTQITLAPINN